jgi:hypothetical protein
VGIKDRDRRESQTVGKARKLERKKAEREKV